MNEARITSLDKHARLEAAADWVDREGEMSESERQTFERWYADADNRAAYQRIAGSMNWITQDGVSQAFEPGATTPASARRRSWIVPSAMAASLLLASGFWLLKPFVPSTPEAPVAQAPVEESLRLESTRGERRSEVLQDGSQLVLNAQSEVQVSLSPRERRVSLNRGQVFFNVARDEQRLFVVNAGEAQVLVLGTRFDVDRTSARTTIAVYEGSVNVQADRSVVLHGGEQISLADGRLGRVETRALGTSPAWRSGWIDVSEEPLAQVVGHLQRYLERDVLIPEGALAEQPVSGRFSLDRPLESLQLLADAHGLSLQSGQDQDRLRLTPDRHR